MHLTIIVKHPRNTKAGGILLSALHHGNKQAILALLHLNCFTHSACLTDCDAYGEIAANR